MAASATPRTAEPSQPTPRRCVAVAYSGGRDSTALLHVTARQAQALGLEVVALHVHHGLSAHADDWLQHCQRQCERWAATGLPLRLQWRRLDDAPGPAESVEAWARAGRYAALSAMAAEAGADLLLLAQHRRDQAETLLLQALRGAGVAGLAGMPARQLRGAGLCWARPWLQQPREAIEAYLQQHALAFIDDDSNGDTRYARNRLRLAVWPSLSAAFPAAEASLAQAADWAQQALTLQQELAREDLQRLDQEGLDVPGLLALSPARASNALRHWLQAQLGRPAPASLVQRLLTEGRAGRGRWPCAGGQLCLYRGRLSLQRAMDDAVLPITSLALDLSRPGLYPLPQWRGCWWVEAVVRDGVPAARLQRLQARARSGGEQFQRHAAGPPRSLKKAYQSQAVPAWQRQGPLLFDGEALLYVPGLGLDARCRAAPGVPQLALQWVSQDAG